MYDIILFENFYLARNHKLDLFQIARMLQHNGLMVAVLNIYGEDLSVKEGEVEILCLPFSARAPRYGTLLGKLLLLIDQYLYMKKVLAYVVPLAKSFYFGSYHYLMPISLLSVDKPVFVWGLRSSRLKNFFKILKQSGPISALHAYILAVASKKNPLLNFFVSNEIIRDEFIKLGFQNNQLILRNERCVENNAREVRTLPNGEISFLVIGALRRQKKVPLTVEAFKRANISHAKLKIVGKVIDGSESEILASIEKDERIERRAGHLDYEEFLSMFRSSNYVLFADDAGDSCISNGTFMEALIHYCPVVAPEYNPFKYYIEKYRVGIMYTPGDVESYANALRLAASQDCSSFEENIANFLDELSYERNAKDLAANVRSVICRK